MYLSELFIENFRTFGSEDEGRHLRMTLRPGLNVLAGENDSGKSAIIDAIRQVLWTTSMEYQRLTEDDFYVSGRTRAPSLRIACQFSGLSKEETARFLEYLSVGDEDKPILRVTLHATRMDDTGGGSRGRRRVAMSVRSGQNAEGPAIEGEVREFLRVTYLRPLRDAESELAAGKGSRLSQILQSHRSFQGQGDDDFNEHEEDDPKTLVGIMRQAEHRVAHNDVVVAARNQLNDDYLERFSIGGDKLSGSIGIANSTELRQILEKLELRLDPPSGQELSTRRGLGFNNVLFMATELLLLGEPESGALPLLLIEEPEAHLHPQLQLRLMDFLNTKCGSEDPSIQVMVTTHSPNLASKVDLESITLVHGGKGFSLAEDCTKLDSSDYRFLRRFLDVTKANLFFAKGVVIVEGDSENILIPLFAELLGRSFSEHGVSIVNVGHRGLFRYARIFQRLHEEEEEMPIRVACLADRDIPTAASIGYIPEGEGENGDNRKTCDIDFTPEEIDQKIEDLKANDGGSVRTFVSPKWTLEHDLALHPQIVKHVYAAILFAKKLKNKPVGLQASELPACVTKANETIDKWRKEGKADDCIAATVYEDLWRKRASKPETAMVLSELLRDESPTPGELRGMLPSYIVEAIDYVTGQTAREEE